MAEKKGADVYDVASAALGAIAGGALGRGIGKMALRRTPHGRAREEFIRNARSRKRYHESDDVASSERAISTVKKSNNRDVRWATRGGAVAGGIGGYSASKIAKDKRR